MRFAEVFLRLGCSLVAWMFVYTYGIWLAALHAMGCGPDGDEMHRVLVGVGIIAAAMAFALRLTRPFADIHRMLSRLAVPLALLAPFALKNVWTVFRQANLGGFEICAQAPAATFDLIWAPAQLMVLGVLTTVLIGVWRAARVEKP